MNELPEVRRPTQRERIVARLRTHPRTCASWFVAHHMSRAAARIHELRRDGWEIETERCTNPYHGHYSPAVEYVLVAEPDELERRSTDAR